MHNPLAVLSILLISCLLSAVLGAPTASSAVNAAEPPAPDWARIKTGTTKGWCTLAGAFSYTGRSNSSQVWLYDNTYAQIGHDLGETQEWPLRSQLHHSILIDPIEYPWAEAGNPGSFSFSFGSTGGKVAIPAYVVNTNQRIAEGRSGCNCVVSQDHKGCDVDACCACAFDCSVPFPDSHNH